MKKINLEARTGPEVIKLIFMLSTAIVKHKFVIFIIIKIQTNGAVPCSDRTVDNDIYTNHLLKCQQQVPLEIL